MRKLLLGLAALMTATAGQAAVQITFTSPSGNVGSNSHTYSNGAYSLTATGYSNYNFTTNTGTANNLYDKNGGGDEIASASPAIRRATTRSGMQTTTFKRSRRSSSMSATCSRS